MRSAAQWRMGAQFTLTLAKETLAMLRVPTEALVDIIHTHTLTHYPSQMVVARTITIRSAAIRQQQWAPQKRILTPSASTQDTEMNIHMLTQGLPLLDHVI